MLVKLQCMSMYTYAPVVSHYALVQLVIQQWGLNDHTKQHGLPLKLKGYNARSCMHMLQLINQTSPHGIAAEM